MSKLAFKGRAKVSVIDHAGREILSSPWQKNLLLDQGMDRLSEVLICDLFAVAVKGTGNDVTSEAVDTGNEYDCTAGVVTRASGAARDFTADDVGKWLGTVDDPNVGGKIASFDSASQVTLEDLTVTFANKDIILYSVHHTGLEAEAGVEEPAATYTKPLGDGTVTASGAAFSADDVGKAIRFPALEVAYEITAFTSGTEVEVDTSPGDQDVSAASGFIYAVRSEEDLLPASRTVTYSSKSGDNNTETSTATRTFTRSFIFDPEDELAEDSGGTTASRAGTTVTASGAFFAADDVGKVIAFDDGTESEIVGFTSTTIVTVADSGVVASQGFTLYGYHTYEEIGFSDLDEPGDNLNIRIKLAAAVNVLGPTGLYPGRQLKVTYEFTVTVSPSTSQSGNLGPIITGGSAMNANQSGTYTIESFSTSRVDATTGETNDDFTLLDPATPGFLGLSTNSDVLDPLGDKVREENVVFVELEPASYNPGSFTQTYEGVFGLNEAIGTSWRTLFLGDQDTNIAVFTFRFANPQTKAGDRIFSMTISKTWARDLS